MRTDGSLLSRLRLWANAQAMGRAPRTPPAPLLTSDPRRTCPPKSNCRPESRLGVRPSETTAARRADACSRQLLSGGASPANSGEPVRVPSPTIGASASPSCATAPAPNRSPTVDGPLQPLSPAGDSADPALGGQPQHPLAAGVAWQRHGFDAADLHQQVDEPADCLLGHAGQRRQLTLGDPLLAVGKHPQAVELRGER